MKLPHFNFNEQSGALAYVDGELIEGVITGTTGTKPENVPPVPPNIFSSIHELMTNRKVINWAIRDCLPLDSTAILYGESGAGKSFCALDMALCVATGTNWHGHLVRQGAVFYIAGEGLGGIGSRCKVWSIANKIEVTELTPFYCSNGAVLLPDERNLKILTSCVDELIESSGATPTIIVLDTLARCFIGDENSARDAGEFVHALDAIRKKYQCCVLVVHHSGKDASKGGRGSSALKAAMDRELCLTVDGIYKRLTTTKAKDTEEPDAMLFKLQQFQTDWLDDDLQIVTSAAMMLHKSNAGEIDKGKPVKLGLRDMDVFKVISETLEKTPIETPIEVKAIYPDSPHLSPEFCVTIEQIRAKCYGYLNVEDDSKRNTLNRVIDKLTALGKIRIYNGYIWIIQ